jgi:hypothetical protein
MLNDWYTFGNSEIYAIDSQGKRIKTIVDSSGKIIDFPGVVEEKVWTDEFLGTLSPYVRYRTEFNKCADGTYIMLWEIQPDGRYWADSDGFGAEHDSEIILYSYIDDKGNFLEPFRGYSVDSKRSSQE